jgi:nitronate monooxygenase
MFQLHQWKMTTITQDYPWTASPLIVSAPMARVAKPTLAVAVSKAQGLGFIAAGYTSDNLEELLQEATELFSDSKTTGSDESTVLPVGVGFITWSASLQTAIPAIKKYRPCAVWLFAPPTGYQDLVPWAIEIRAATSQKTKIWVQIGSVADAIQVARIVAPDVLVVQGSDAGGHSQARGASVVTLVPEVADKIGTEIQRPDGKSMQLIAAGGICDGRGVAAAANLGAQGCVLGTRFLASPESLISQAYQNEILRASDGGVTTVRTTIYDTVRDINGWPDKYNGRGLINQTYMDYIRGMPKEENKELYLQAMEEDGQGYGPKGRLTTYAGTGVGLVNHVMAASDIVTSVRNLAYELLCGRSKASRL